MMQVYLLFDDGDATLIEPIVQRIKGAGYEPTHPGTALIGTSVIDQAIEALNDGVPVVLFATPTSVGSERIRRFVNAANTAGPNRVFTVKMLPDTAIDRLGFKEKVADFASNPQLAAASLIASLQHHFPLPTRSTELAADSTSKALGLDNQPEAETTTGDGTHESSVEANRSFVSKTAAAAKPVLSGPAQRPVNRARGLWLIPAMFLVLFIGLVVGNQVPHDFLTGEDLRPATPPPAPTLLIDTSWRVTPRAIFGHDKEVVAGAATVDAVDYAHSITVATCNRDLSIESDFGGERYNRFSGHIADVPAAGAGSPTKATVWVRSSKAPNYDLWVLLETYQVSSRQTQVVNVSLPLNTAALRLSTTATCDSQVVWIDPKLSK